MRRTVVTGIGVVAPGGPNREAFWATITAGKTATRRISLFDPEGFRSQLAAECDFNGLAAGLSPEQVERADRFVQFALVAAAEALEDSGLELTDGERDRLGVVLGSAVGGTTGLENEFLVVSNGGQDWLVDESKASPWLYETLVPSSLPAEVALAVGAHGPVTCVSTGCTSGIDAVGVAHQLVQDGEADVIIAGASDSPISPISSAAFDAIRATSPYQGDPATASRPFDRDRDGFILGEGCAILLLEELEHARRRGARIYCEVTGYASRSNAFHMTGLKPDGLDMAEAITDALGQAGVQPSDISYISAHGSGTLQNDRHETAAYKKALGDAAYGIPISSIKSMVGHSLGAIGSIEMAACALAVDRGVIPPTANYSAPDPKCDLDYTPNTARIRQVDVALSVGSGFGGFQSAMIVQALPETVAAARIPAQNRMEPTA